MRLKFDKEMTAIIKGIAVIVMIIHHCGIPNFWDSPLIGLNSKIIVSFAQSCKICVGIFTFMVGYGYAFAKDKNFKYSIDYIFKLLVPFWVIIVLFTLPVAYEEMNVKSLVLNLFGINSQYNWFSWFVAFYIFAMIVMPFISKTIDLNPIKWGGVFILVFYLFGVAIHELLPDYTSNDFTQRIFDCCLQMPCLILGYVFAKKKWFENIDIPKIKYLPIMSIALFAVTLVSRNRVGSSIWGFNLDFIYAPLVILSILVLFNSSRLYAIRRLFFEFGKVSVYMWFFHALFFTGITRDFYQPIVAISNSFWVNTIWTIVVTFICSWGLLRLEMLVKNKLNILPWRKTAI